MTLAPIIISGFFGFAAIALFILAIRQSYRIERMKRPDLPKPRLVYTNIIASAFGSAPSPEAVKARGNLRVMLLACLALLMAGAASSFALRPAADPLDGVHAADFLPPGGLLLEPGTILYYTRSNQDGTLPETIIIHLKSDRELEVAKMVERCTSAALVTARFDPRTGEAIQMVGGRLGRDGKQEPQAWLDFDAATRKINVRFGDPKSDPVETHDAPPAPWRMYDFDLAEFALYGARVGEDFSFGVAMTWTDGTSPAVRMLGGAEAQVISSGMRMNRPVTIYAVTGEAFGGPDGDGGGLLTLDTEYGYVIEARLGRPNHKEYDDLHIKLDGMNYGAEAFAADLADHWAGCPG